MKQSIALLFQVSQCCHIDRIAGPVVTSLGRTLLFAHLISQTYTHIQYRPYSVPVFLNYCAVYYIVTTCELDATPAAPTSRQGPDNPTAGTPAPNGGHPLIIIVFFCNQPIAHIKNCPCLIVNQQLTLNEWALYTNFQFSCAEFS